MSNGNNANVIGHLGYICARPDAPHHPAGTPARWDRGEAESSIEGLRRWARVARPLAPTVWSGPLDWVELRRVTGGRCGFEFTGRRGALNMNRHRKRQAAKQRRRDRLAQREARS